MKRKGYATLEMINEVKELKKNGVRQFILTAYVGASQITEFRKTANGISAWANHICERYPNATVEVEYIDKEYKLHLLTTYHC